MEVGLFNSSMQAWPKPGTIISIPTYLFFRHKGIVSDQWHNGKPMVISNSARAGGVHEESWDIFTQGLAFTIDGFPGNAPHHEVLARSRSRIGTAYNLLKWNCEHLVTFAHGFPPHSQQVAATTAILAIVGGLYAATRG